MKDIQIGKHRIGENKNTYFIADIAANHDGDIERAKKLIYLAKEAGADAVKLQHHNVKKYVSDFGFKELGGKFSHQKKWDKSIYKTYKDAEVPVDWTAKLKNYSDEIEIDFLSTPYDLDMVDHLAPYVAAYKIGSGDINWHAMLEKVAKSNKPVIISTGASNILEVQNAVTLLLEHTKDFALLQCNTNYTGSIDNIKYVNINVLKTYNLMYPNIVIGLSDHTPGHVTTLGAVALGAKIIEKHFTDDTTRKGPDHPFSMDPRTWKNMVDDTRLLEKSLGSTQKYIVDNEKDTIVLQRRAIRVIRDLSEEMEITRDDIEFQRPCPHDAFEPNKIEHILGKKINRPIANGDYLRKENIKW